MQSVAYGTITATLVPVVDDAALNNAALKIERRMSQGSMNALSGINSVRAAERSYQASKTARLTIEESQKAARRLYDYAGNPFLVVSNLTSSISGIKQIKDGFARVADQTRHASADVQHYSKMLDMLKASGISKSSNLYKQFERERKAAKTSLDAAQKEEQVLQGKTRGAGFAGRLALDFGLQQLATGAMFTFAFQGAAMVMEGLGNTAVQMFERITNPAKEASISFNKLADSVQKAGGKENLQFFGTALLNIATAAEKAAASQPALDAIASVLNAAAQQAVTGLTPEQAAAKAARPARIAESLSAFKINLGPGTIWDETRMTPKAINDTINDWGQKARDAFFNALSKNAASSFAGMSPAEIEQRFSAGIGQSFFDVLINAVAPNPTLIGKRTTFGAALEAAANAALDDLSAAAQKSNAAKTKLQTIANNIKSGIEGFAALRSGVMQRLDLGFRLASLSGNAADLHAALGQGGIPQQLGPGLENSTFNTFIREYDQVNTDLLAAQTALANKQLAATNAGIAAQYEQIRMQKAQIKAGIARSMIGRVGMTGFELAAQIAEAREQARVARLQLRAQEKQLGMQASIARTSQRVADLNSRKEQLTLRQEAADAQRLADAEAYAKATYKAFTGTEKGDPVADIIARKLGEAIAK